MKRSEAVQKYIDYFRAHELFDNIDDRQIRIIADDMVWVAEKEIGLVPTGRKLNLGDYKILFNYHKEFHERLLTWEPEF